MFDPDKIRFAGPEEIEFPILSTEEDVEEELTQDSDQPEPLIVLPMINAVHFPGIEMCIRDRFVSVLILESLH